MKTPAIRTLIVEDQQMFRSFLEKWLCGLPEFTLVGSARTGEEALELVSHKQPDIVLLDLQLPNMDGLHFIRAARQIRPLLRTLVLTSLVDSLALTRVREAGVEGYLEKDAPLDLLGTALTTVARGESYYSARFRENLSREGSRAEAVGKILSRREQEVLAHVLQGRTSREISDLIALSPRTIEFHRANIMSKLGASNLAELVANARQRGLG
jgi:DNA-binding NarL/FixJ family response regulator